MKEHPDVKVVLQPVADYGDYHTKLLAQLASGTAPDVFYIGDDKIGQFVSSNALLPLTSLMNSSASKTKPEDFAQGLFGVTKKGDEIYAAPNDSNPDAMWYDKVALKKAGITDDPATLAAEGKWTTEAYLDMNKKLKKAGLTGSMFWNYWSTHYGWISSQGGKAFDESGKFVANTDQTSVDAMDVSPRTSRTTRSSSPTPSPRAPGADSVFVSHKAGFFVQGRYTIGTVKSAGDPENYDVAPWPTPDGKAAPTGTAVSYLAINAKTKNKDAAFEFWTNFLSRPRARPPGCRAAATLCRRSRVRTRSFSTATRSTRRRCSTCATSASRTPRPKRPCPGSRATSATRCSPSTRASHRRRPRSTRSPR